MTHVSVPQRGARYQHWEFSLPDNQEAIRGRTGTFPGCQAGFESLLCPWASPPVRTGLKSAATS